MDSIQLLYSNYMITIWVPQSQSVQLESQLCQQVTIWLPYGCYMVTIELECVAWKPDLPEVNIQLLYAVTTWLLYGKYMVTIWVPYCYYMVTIQLLYGYHTVTIWLLYGYHMVTIWLLYSYYTVTIQLLYGYYMITIELECAAQKTALLATSQTTLTTTLPTFQCYQSLRGRGKSGFVPNIVQAHRILTDCHENNTSCNCQCSLPVPKRITVLQPHPSFPSKYKGAQHCELLNKGKFKLVDNQLHHKLEATFFTLKKCLKHCPCPHCNTQTHTHPVWTYKQNQRTLLFPLHKKANLDLKDISFSCVTMLGFWVGKRRQSEIQFTVLNFSSSFFKIFTGTYDIVNNISEMPRLYSAKDKFKKKKTMKVYKT